VEINVLDDDAANSLSVRVEDDFIVLEGELDEGEKWALSLSVVEAARLQAALTEAITEAD